VNPAPQLLGRLFDPSEIRIDEVVACAGIVAAEVEEGAGKEPVAKGPFPFGQRPSLGMVARNGELREVDRPAVRISEVDPKNWALA